MNLTEPLRRTLSCAVASAAITFLASPGIQAQDARTAGGVRAPGAHPEASPPGVMIAGQDVPVPTRRKYVAPEYPAEAAIQGIRGIVILELVIGEEGRVESVRVTRSIPGLDEAATSAVRLWEYEPTKVSGKRVRVQLSQSITFAARLPNLQRTPGVPELKSGGAPPVPPSLASPETASVAVTLGGQGEVAEVAVLEGNPAVSEALLRAVRSWRFALTEGSEPPSFTVRAEWTPGRPPTLVLKALDVRSAAPATAAPAEATDVESVPLTSPETVAASATEARHPALSVETEVLPARPEPPVKEEGVSGIPDVVLGENIPDLVRGRRPVWPPLARLGNVTGEVTVRFSVDLAGRVTVHSAEGPELLKESAEQAVGTWLFRRTSIETLNLIAVFKLGGDRAVARVDRAPAEAS